MMFWPSGEDVDESDLEPHPTTAIPDKAMNINKQILLDFINHLAIILSAIQGELKSQYGNARQRSCLVQLLFFRLVDRFPMTTMVNFNLIVSLREGIFREAHPLANQVNRVGHIELLLFSGFKL
jgi:hypothetical protein